MFFSLTPLEELYMLGDCEVKKVWIETADHENYFPQA